MKKHLNTIITIIICLIVVLSSIIVGTPLKENTKIITTMVAVILPIYIILYKLILKNKYKDIFKQITVIDICVIVLCLCPFIPIIFKTALNYEESLNVAIRYLTVLGIYIISKILIIQNSKYKEYFCTALIVTGIISAVIGIDNLTTGYFTKALYKIGIPYLLNIEQRMFGSFGYANSFAMSLTIPLMLSLDKYVKNEKFKNFYIGICVIFLSCIILSYSRATYLVIVIAMLLYCILQRNGEKILKLINTSISILIFSSFYAKIFANYYTSKEYFILFGSIVALIIMCSIFTNLINKIINIKTWKKYWFVFLITFIAFIYIVIIGLNIGKPLKLFKEGNTGTLYISQKVRNIEGKKNYVFEFDVISKTIDNSEMYKIQLMEKTSYNKVLETHEINFGTINEKITFNFMTKKDTDYIEIAFRCLNSKKQNGLIINKLEINGENYILDYLYLPKKLVDRLQSFDTKVLLSEGRVVIYGDALKLIKLNPWTGVGGNGWRHVFEKEMEKKLESTEVHSYLLQLFLEFGIVSIVVYIILLIVLLINLKKIKKEECGIIVALFTILLHSMIDFDLSFMNILMYTYLLIGISSRNKVKKNE